MRKITGLIFYSNLFYGICAVALSIETNLQYGIALNRLPFYILIFLATFVYYSSIYYRSSYHINSDERTGWYRGNRSAIKTTLIISVAAIIGDVAYMIAKNYHALYSLPPLSWVMIAGVLLIGSMYTFKILPLQQLRQVGWLKPFVIGFVWVGIVTIFPIHFWHVKHPDAITPTLVPAGLLWLQNFLFISALAIVFDIKDYDSDKRLHLNTFPATLGVSRTISLVIVPLTLLSFAALFIFQLTKASPVSHTVIQALPYVALLIVCKSLPRQQNLLFYLAIIDGLMLFKGICGIISISLF